MPPIPNPPVLHLSTNLPLLPPPESFTLRGFIRVVYLGISLKIPLNNSFQVAMSKRDAITGALYEYIDTSKLAQTASMQQRRERAYIEKTSTSLP